MDIVFMCGPTVDSSGNLRTGDEGWEVSHSLEALQHFGADTEPLRARLRLRFLSVTP